MRVRVDYHFHTAYSYDSELPIDAVIERAAGAGLDVLCVADHDTIDGALKLRAEDPPVRIVVGCEFTTADGSHVVGLDLEDMIVERDLFALLDAIHAQGGLVLLPHPFRRGSGILRAEVRRSPAFVERLLGATDLVECFNGGDTWEKNRQNLGFAREHAIGSVASSDAHTAARLGTVWVEYDGEPFVHGMSARRLYFPTQAPVAEHPAKRRALEAFHRHKDRLPRAVLDAYRRSRRAMRRDAVPTVEAVPRFQYELPGEAER